MDKTGISVVINTYNAERYLERVLESVKDFDEIVVCDMESTDNTVAIAKKHGAKVVTFPKGESKICEPARDFAVHSASCPWVLVVDADELITPELHDYLYEQIKGSPTFAALDIPRVNRLFGAPIKGTPDYQLRFLFKDKTHWPAIIHARPEVQGEIRKVPNKPRLSLQHLDDADITSRLNKLNTYTNYEVPKRLHKTYGIGKMIFRPALFFLKSYIFGKGYKEGKRGVVNAYMSALYQMVFLSKLTESQISNKKP